MHFRLGAGYDVALGGTSTPGPHPIPIGVKAVRLQPTGNCYVSIGPAPVAVPGLSTLLTAGSFPSIVNVNAGDLIAVIEATGATGVLNITELTH